MGDDRRDKSNRILVFRIGQLGDTVVALPAFWMLRSAYPAASITLLTNAPGKRTGAVGAGDVLPATGLFDNVITYPSHSGMLAALFSRAALARRLRRQKFERAFYMMPRNRTKDQISRDLRFLRLAGVRSVSGAEFLRQNLLEFPIPVPTPEVISEADFLVSLLNSEGISEVSKPDGLLRISNEERQFAVEWLSNNCKIADGQPIIAVAPGSNWQSKVWEVKRFQSVVGRLILEFNVFPIVVGGCQDMSIGESLVQAWKTGSNAAGKLNVRRSAAVLERCGLFLGNDTGTMHLAAAVQTPCVAVFAAVDWIGKWTPFGSSRNRIFRSHVECEGCHLENCPFGNRCLDLISTEHVYAACAEALKQDIAREGAHKSKFVNNLIGQT